MSISPTRSAVRWRRARARCWWSTPARGSRRRPSPMSTRRSAAGHEIVPVLNKIDLPAAEPDRVREQIEDVIGLDASDAVLISAKTGLNIEGVLEALVTRLPAPVGDRGRAPQGAVGRQLVRRLSRRRHPGAGQGRQPCARPEDPADGDRRRPQCRAGRRVHPEGRGGAGAGAGRDRLYHRRDQDRRRLPGRRHHHRRPPPRRRRRWPGSSRCSRWCSAASSRSIRPITSICARASASCGSTTPASSTSRKPRRRSASASAAASSGCSIWRSSRSG